MFSHAFFGTLKTLDGHELCLKLFGGRFFSTPLPNEFHVRDEDGDEGLHNDPAFRPWSRNFSCAFDRLIELWWLCSLKQVSEETFVTCDQLWFGMDEEEF